MRNVEKKDLQVLKDWQITPSFKVLSKVLLQDRTDLLERLKNISLSDDNSKIIKEWCEIKGKVAIIDYILSLPEKALKELS